MNWFDDRQTDKWTDIQTQGFKTLKLVYIEKYELNIHLNPWGPKRLSMNYNIYNM